MPLAVLAEPGSPDALGAQRILLAAFEVDRAPPTSVFDGAQVVSFYGFPGQPVMGKLGAFSPEQAAQEVTRVAAEYDALNGETDVIPALHLIVAVAQPLPQPDGTYLSRLPAYGIAPYVEVAREYGLLLFLDLQIGWADPLAEVQELEDALIEPFVHVALDAEFATRTRGEVPGSVIGSLEAAEVNAVQRYLDALVREHDLPAKILVLHQFLDRMLVDPDQYAAFDGVEVVIDMDGFGGQGAKLSKYDRYALSDYSERAAIKLFYDWDTPLLTPEQLQSLEYPPDLVIYQ